MDQHIFLHIQIVGENGVGRRSIIESLAYKITKNPENVPERLRNTKIIELSVDNLYGCNVTNNICTTFFNALKSLKVYDAFNYDLPPNPKLMSIEEKKAHLYGNNPPPTAHDEDVERLFNEMVESVQLYRENREKTNQPKILFIHQFYNMVDDYSYSFYDSVSSVLQPLLEKKRLKLVTCMTPSEYAKFTKNPLASHFEVIKVGEPNFATTLDIVTKKKEYLEASHGVFIDNDIVEEALLLSNRYIPLKANPMKCISVLDELASIVEKRGCSIPINVLELEDKIKKVSIDIDKKSDDDIDTSSLMKKLEKLKESYATKYSAWKAEYQALQSYRENRVRLIGLKKELGDCIASITSPDCESAKRASKIIEDDIPEVKASLKIFEKQSAKNKYVNNRATLDDLSVVISRMSGIPQKDLYFTTQKNHSLNNMESILEEQVIGQKQAISSISKTIRVAKLGLRDANKPQASLLFCGFSGVGKTELAKQIAKVVYGNENSVSVIDMTKYNTEFSVSGLIGTSAGYVGYDDGGELTNTIKKNPFQVIIFDEIEKAHSRVWNILLPVFEEGVCQNNYGESVSLKDTIIILTSNVGTKRLFQHKEEDKDLTQQEIFHEEIKETFAPEFLNRLDDIVIFNELSMHDLDKILSIQLRKLEERLSKKREIKIELSTEARQFLIFNSFDIQLGARPIKRNIQNYLSAPISDLFYQGKLDKHCTLKVDVDEKKLKVEVIVDEKKESQEKRKRNNDYDDLLELDHKLKNAIKSSNVE